ncbi:MAG: hypothetical protein GEU97_11210 [Actinophytocola sp.]|nr:hypothetical protein [Actinophytocola sp.]
MPRQRLAHVVVAVVGEVRVPLRDLPIAVLNGDIHGSFWDTAGSSLVAWSGETAGDRIVRLCDEESVPLRGVGDMSDTAAMGPQRIDTLLNLLDECAKVDMGILGNDRDALRLVYLARSGFYNRSVALALDYANGEVAPAFEPTEDDRLIRNDVAVKRPRGGSYRAVRQGGPLSVDEIGRYDTAPTINVASDDQLPDQAHWRLHVGTVDEPRYPVITVRVHALDAATAADALEVRVGDRITISNLPKWLPPGDADLLVQGIRERYGDTERVLRFLCVPASPWDAVVVGETKVDTAGSELDSGISDSATSMDVATTVGEDWTTDSGEFPFDVEVGGEEITISDIGSAVDGVQTFTISERSVNGITKSHDTGTGVRIARKHRAVVWL